MPGLQAMRGARARSRARTRRGRLCGWLARSAPSAGAAANAAPAAATACARRSLSGRRRSGPLACPALLAFFPLPEGGGGDERSGVGGGAARAEGGGGRGRGEGGGERQAAPPPGCRRSPISRSLKLDPESGARDCITDYIRLYRASRSHIRGGARAGGGLGKGSGITEKGCNAQPRAPRTAGSCPTQQESQELGLCSLPGAGEWLHLGDR